MALVCCKTTTNERIKTYNKPQCVSTPGARTQKQVSGSLFVEDCVFCSMLINF